MSPFDLSLAAQDAFFGLLLLLVAIPTSRRGFTWLDHFLIVVGIIYVMLGAYHYLESLIP